MKALVFTAINEPMEYKEVANPAPQRGQVIVNVKAGALNHRDVWIQKGMYAGIKTPTILGSDGAGVYNGDAVLINPSNNWGTNPVFQGKDYKILGLPDDGTFAEQVAVNKSLLHAKPAHLSFEEVAALPLAGLTAYRSLFTKCKVKKGEKVLISGVGGGVALFAAQFAIALGAKVYVTSSSNDKIERARKLGAVAGANYTQQDWAKQFVKEHGGVDVVIDGACGDGFNDLVTVSNAGARIAFYGATRGNLNGLNPRPVFWKQISIFGSTMGNNKDFSAMLKLVNEHKITPVVDAVFDLKDGNNALKLMDEGKQFGKIVLKV